MDGCLSVRVFFSTIKRHVKKLKRDGKPGTVGAYKTSRLKSKSLCSVSRRAFICRRHKPCRTLLGRRYSVRPSSFRRIQRRLRAPTFRQETRRDVRFQKHFSIRVRRVKFTVLFRRHPGRVSTHYTWRQWMELDWYSAARVRTSSYRQDRSFSRGSKTFRIGRNSRTKCVAHSVLLSRDGTWKKEKNVRYDVNDIIQHNATRPRRKTRHYMLMTRVRRKSRRHSHKTLSERRKKKSSHITVIINDDVRNVSANRK